MRANQSLLTAVVVGAIILLALTGCAVMMNEQTPSLLSLI
jgi:hypothetical protein